MTLFPLTDCCERLSVDPKTLRQWIKHAAMPLHAHPTDARVKCLTLPQVQQLASSHGRILQPHPVLPLGSGASTSVCGEPQPLTSPASPASPSEADLHQKLTPLEAPAPLLPPQLPPLPPLLLLAHA